MSRFDFSSSPPAFVPELPRDYRGDEGEVVKEVGVIEETSDGKRYWKAFQLINRDGGDDLVRTGYYTETGGWQNKPLTLPPGVMEDLTGFAEGKIWE